MTTILRDSALALPLPLLAGLGAWLEGPWGAAGVIASSIVTLGNLALLWVIVDGLVRATVAGSGGGAAIGLIFFKTTVALTGYGALLFVFPPLSVALGLGTGLVGLSIHAVIDALQVPHDGARAEDA